MCPLFGGFTVAAFGLAFRRYAYSVIFTRTVLQGTTYANILSNLSVITSYGIQVWHMRCALRNALRNALLESRRLVESSPSVNMQEGKLASPKHRKQDEGEIYVKLV